MTPSIKFSIQQVYSFYFKPILEEQDETTCYYRCHGGTARKKEIKTGYSNIIDHVRQKNPD